MKLCPTTIYNLEFTLYHSPLFSPSLGRPLQPNSQGGVPLVPQALNRYAATSLGQPGVAQAAVSDPFLWRLILATRNQIPGTLAGIAIDQATITTLQKQTIQRAVPSGVGLIEVIHPPTTGVSGFVTRLTQSRLGQGLTKLPFMGKGITAYYSNRNIRTLARLFIGTEVGGSFGAGEAIATGNGSIRLLAQEINYVDEVVTKQVTRGLGRVGIGLSVFTAGALSGAIQYAHDSNNPYLTNRDKAFRGGISTILGSTATGIGLAVEYAIVGSVGGPVGIGVAVLFGVGFELWLAPIIFEGAGTVETRLLEPIE